MRCLIAYAGRSGSTKKAARMLAAYFKDVDVKDLNLVSPDPGRYEVVIVGSCIRMGKIEQAARAYLMKNERALGERKLGLFICNGLLGEVPDIIERNFPKALLDECVCVDSFGGEVDFERLGFFERKIAGAALKRYGGAGNAMQPCILTDRIKVFAEKIIRACS